MMACSKRNSLLSVYIGQLLLTGWRQIFDYLGFMWAPIIVNFFHIIFLIFGFFGSWQYKAGYLISCSIWSVVWIGWNIFLMCFYLNVGALNREWDLLSLGTGSVSWWELNGPGCKVLFLANQTALESPDPWRPPRPDLISGCVIPFYLLESSQAALHIILAVIAIYLGLCVASAIKNGIEPKANGKLNKLTMPTLYAAEYISSRNNNNETASLGDSDLEVENGGVSSSASARNRPMTPRRVKRRSIHSREHPGGSSSSLGGGAAGLSGSRRSRHGHRQSGRRHHHHQGTLGGRPASSYHPGGGSTGTLSHQGHTNLMYQSSSTNSLLMDPDRPGSARSSYSNFHGTRAYSYRQSGRASNNFFAAGPPGYTSYQSETGV